VQGTPHFALGQCAIGFSRSGARAGGIERADGVQRRVVFRNAGKIELGEVRRPEAARADAPGKLGGAGERVDALV